MYRLTFRGQASEFKRGGPPAARATHTSGDSLVTRRRNRIAAGGDSCAREYTHEQGWGGEGGKPIGMPNWTKGPEDSTQGSPKAPTQGSQEALVRERGPTKKKRFVQIRIKNV
jgi:hypothetical protein